MEATQVSTTPIAGGSPGTHVGHCPRTNLHGREDGGTGRLLLARWIVSSLCLRFQLCPLVATMAQLSQPESLPALTLSLSAIDLSVCAALPPPPISSQPCGSEVTDQATGAWGGELGAPGGASWGSLAHWHSCPVSPLPLWSRADKNFKGTFCCVSTISPRLSPLSNPPLPSLCGASRDTFPRVTLLSPLCPWKVRRAEVCQSGIPWLCC